MQRIRYAILTASMLFSFVAIFTSVPQEAFASPQIPTLAHTSSWSRPTRETWNGIASPNSGESFTIQLGITFYNPNFTGVLYSHAQGTTWASVFGYIGSGEFAPYGAVYFTTTTPASGNICLGCHIDASFSDPNQTQMSGNWYPPTENVPAGSLTLNKEMW